MSTQSKSLDLDELDAEVGFITTEWSVREGRTLYRREAQAVAALRKAAPQLLAITRAAQRAVATLDREEADTDDLIRAIERIKAALKVVKS